MGKVEAGPSRRATYPSGVRSMTAQKDDVAWTGKVPTRRKEVHAHNVRKLERYDFIEVSGLRVSC